MFCKTYLQRLIYKGNKPSLEGTDTYVSHSWSFVTLKSMAFKGRDPVRTKIVIDNKIIEQVNSFNYLGNIISYEKEMDIDNKLHNYLKITGIINNVFRPQETLKKTRIKLYNTLALPVLLYGSETWTIKARDARRITAAEMKYMRTAGYTWADYKTNSHIAKN